MTAHITNIREVETTNLRERVARALRAAIISGELVAGQVYSAPSSARSSVSRPPRSARRCSTSSARTSWKPCPTRASG